MFRKGINEEVWKVNWAIIPTQALVLKEGNFHKIFKKARYI